MLKRLRQHFSSSNDSQASSGSDPEKATRRSQGHANGESANGESAMGENDRDEDDEEESEESGSFGGCQFPDEGLRECIWDGKANHNLW